MCTHNICFEQKYGNSQKYSTENCHFYSREKFLYIAWACFRNDCHVAAIKIKVYCIGGSSLCYIPTMYTMASQMLNESRPKNKGLIEKPWIII